jgi:outer membrane scaffolding protein for murein synthesis (MipA/OmpV family)
VIVAILPARFAGVLLAALVASIPVKGQTLLDVGPGTGSAAGATSPAGNWTLTLGALGIVRPAYEGSDAYLFGAAPIFDLRFRDLAFASVRDGIGINVVREDWLKLAPVIRYRCGRDQDDNRALQGLGDVNGTIEGGVLATVGPGPVQLRLEAVQGLNGDGHKGFLARADLTYGMPVGRDIFVAGGPSVTYADRRFSQTYFGIDADQARRSGYRVYDANAGFKDIGFGVNANWRFWRSFSVVGVAEVKQLLGDVADSPIVKDETQGFVGLGITWRGGF